MLSFISRRVIIIVLVSIAIVFSVQLGMRMIRNSEARQPDFNIVGQANQAWRETQSYLEALLDGRLGVARTGQGTAAVGEVLRDSFGKSLGLLAAALLLAMLVGVPVGAFAALTRVRQLVLPLLMLTVLGISTPSFVAGLLLRLGELRYLAIVGRPLVKMAGFGWDLQHMLLPVLVLAARPLAYLARASFLSLRQVMGEDFIRTAYAKGLPQGTVVNVHALRNVAVPIMTAIGVSLRFSLSTLPVVEFFFVWPGIGLRLLDAINLREATLASTLALALGGTFLVLNLVLDIAYRQVDPRLREGS